MNNPSLSAWLLAIQSFTLLLLKQRLCSPSLLPPLSRCTQSKVSSYGNTLSTNTNTNISYRPTYQPRYPKARMPSFQRQVAFSSSNTVSRQPHDDELEAIRRFASHASHCRKCAHPYEVHVNGGTLCDRGHHYAQNVASYVYNKAGKAYSVMDRNDGLAPTQVEIPVNCGAVRELLKAMERGLRLRQTPLISYDRTYPIAPRLVMAAPHPPAQQIIEIPHRRHSTIHHAVARRSEEPYISGRGSLYASDMNDRHRRYLADSGLYSTRQYSARDGMVINESRRHYR